MSFKIDGYIFPVEWERDSLSTKAEIMNGAKSGRCQDRTMFLQYLGTFYSYSGRLIRQRNCTDSDYDKLFNLLKRKNNVHTLSLPFAQGEMSGSFYIASVKRTYFNDRQKWKNGIEVTFVPMKCQAKYGDSNLVNNSGCCYGVSNIASGTNTLSNGYTSNNYSKTSPTQWNLNKNVPA